MVRKTLRVPLFPKVLPPWVPPLCHPKTFLTSFFLFLQQLSHPLPPPPPLVARPGPSSRNRVHPVSARAPSTEWLFQRVLPAPDLGSLCAIPSCLPFPSAGDGLIKLTFWLMQTNLCVWDFCSETGLGTAVEGISQQPSGGACNGAEFRKNLEELQGGGTQEWGNSTPYGMVLFSFSLCSWGWVWSLLPLWR